MLNVIDLNNSLISKIYIKCVLCDGIKFLGTGGKQNFAVHKTLIHCSTSGTLMDHMKMQNSF